MKRAISRTLASRLYASYSWDLLTSLSERLDDVTHKFFVPNTNTEKCLIVLITSNRGLCGGYNSQVIKKTIVKIKEEVGIQKVDLITVGKKGDSAMRRTGQNVVAAFTDMPDNVSLSDILPLSTYLTNEFKEEKYSKIYIAYTDFVSALSQKPVIRQILPISKKELKESIDSIGESGTTPKLVTKKEVPYIFEGDTEELLNSLAEKLIRMQIYQMLLESNASEQSSRMVAMKNANEAAGEMIDDLTLVFNKARQAGITREISEISAGMAAAN
jgi:F-type H+-transporting ATPase subunit gamma